jgi:ribosome biogenesis GTPase
MFKIKPNTFVIDTPGIKELGINEIDNRELYHFFPEMRKFFNQCKYYNCVHVHEPDCAVKKAVNEGEIAFTRYESYLSMLANEDNRK